MTLSLLTAAKRARFKVTGLMRKPAPDPGGARSNRTAGVVKRQGPALPVQDQRIPPEPPVTTAQPRGGQDADVMAAVMRELSSPVPAAPVADVVRSAAPSMDKPGIALMSALFQARSWINLRGRLRQHGFGLCPAGNGLSLICLATGNRVSDIAEYGVSYSSLMRHFDAPYPGHGQAYLFLRKRQVRQGSGN